MSDLMDLAGYVEGLEAGELRFQRCTVCGKAQFPPRPVCATCRSAALAWERFPETATVFTWTVVGHTRLPAFAQLTPYAVAVLEVRDLGVRIVGRLDAPADTITVGARCRWRVGPGPDGDPVPLWTLDEGDPHR